MKQPIPIRKGMRQARKLTRSEAQSNEIARLNSLGSSLQLQLQKSNYQLDVAVQVLNVVVSEIAAQAGVSFEDRVKAIRSEIPIFAVRQKASPREAMVVNGKPKDVWFWDRAPGASGYRYRFITEATRTEGGQEVPGKPLKWNVIGNNVIENPDGYPSIQVFPIYAPMIPEKAPELVPVPAN